MLNWFDLVIWLSLIVLLYWLFAVDVMYCCGFYLIVGEVCPLVLVLFGLFGIFDCLFVCGFDVW